MGKELQKISMIDKRCLLTDRYAYSFYLQRRDYIPDKYKVESLLEYATIVKKIFEVTSKYLIESIGGVVLDEIGYFVNWMLPDRKVIFLSRKGREAEFANYHSDGRFYYTLLITDVFQRSLLRGWMMDRAFNTKHVKRKLAAKLKSGFKYGLYLSLVRNIFKKVRT